MVVFITNYSSIVLSKKAKSVIRSIVSLVPTDINLQKKTWLHIHKDSSMQDLTVPPPKKKSVFFCLG